MRAPRFRTQVLFLASLVAGAAIIWWPRQDPPVPPLRALPTIAHLTRAELTQLPDEQLLPRIQLECVRQILAAGGNWRSGPEILPPMAFNLWAIEAQETTLLQSGFATVVHCERDPRQTPLGPTLAQVADAYAAVGLAPLAAVVREAAAHPDKGSTPRDDTAFAELDARFRQAIGSGTQTWRLAYARKHRAALMDRSP